jgi:hypothetical protein
MHFYKYPRLGAYLGVLLEMEKKLLEKELIGAVENRLMYKENLGNKKKEVDERVREIMETLREKEENEDEEGVDELKGEA